jgi:hypothetical protein
MKKAVSTPIRKGGDGNGYRNQGNHHPVEHNEAPRVLIQHALMIMTSAPLLAHRICAPRTA